MAHQNTEDLSLLPRQQVLMKIFYEQLLALASLLMHLPKGTQTDNAQLP